MNKDQYLRKLEYLLSDLPEEERREAMEYYVEYFEEAGPEREAEVMRELGTPETVALSGREEAEKGKKRLADRIYRARMCACVTGGDPARYCTVWSCDRGSGMRGCTDRKRCRTGCQYCSSLPCSSNSFVCSWNIQYGTSTCRTDDDRHLLPMRGIVPALWLGTHQALCSCCTGSDQRLYSFDRYAVSRKGGT